jgi:hypothetical protein
VTLPSFLSNGSEGATVNAIHALTKNSDRPAFSNELGIMLSEVQPPSFGRTSLTTNGTISAGESEPSPDQSSAVFAGKNSQTVGERETLEGEGRQTTLGEAWTCTPSDDLRINERYAPGNIPPNSNYDSDSCGAVAVIYAPGAQTARDMFMLIASALFALVVDRTFRACGRVRDASGTSV